MRIIAGRLGGRVFAAPHSARTHPMADRVRGALFNILGDIDGLTLLDPFAGSGAIGFEALSRGVARVVMIEADKPAQLTIRQNIIDLRLARQARLITANCSVWSDRNPDEQFDLLIADPPYDDPRPALVAKLLRHVRPGGNLVLSWPGKQPPPELPVAAGLVAQKLYGDAQLLFYECTEKAAGL